MKALNLTIIYKINDLETTIALILWIGIQILIIELNSKWSQII